MVVLGRVENVREWWDRIATYWLRRQEKKKGTLLQLAKIHARIQCVHLPPQPSWPKDLFTKGASSAYFEAVIETMKQNKVSSVPEPSLGRVKASHQRKRSPPPHSDSEPPRKKHKDRRRTRCSQLPHSDHHMWS